MLRKVMGRSMMPSLCPGMVVFGVRPRKVRPGDIVIVRHENLDKIKRVHEVRPGEVFLTGDNSLHTTDSRDFGWLEMNVVMAKVVWVFGADGRAG